MGLGFGCTSLDSNQDLPGDNVVHQVMVGIPSTPFSCINVDEEGTCVGDPLADPLGSGFALTFGRQVDYNLCGYNSTTVERLGDCPVTAENVQLVCAMSGDAKGHCLDPNTGKEPIVQHADPAAVNIRMVLGRLLAGTTVETFACACQTVVSTANGTLNATACTGGAAFSLDPFNCGVCGGDPTVVGKCLDVDLNGLPDVTALLPDVGLITCGTLLSYSTKLGEGSYYPSGSQIQSTVLGLAGMGPALSIIPSVALPTDADCTVAIGAAVKFKESTDSVDQSNGPFVFHTDVLGVDVDNSVPANGEEDVAIDDPDGSKAMDTDPPTITVFLNVPVLAGSVTDDSVQVFEGADPATGTLLTTTAVEADGGIQVTLPGNLTPDTVYTVVVPAGKVGENFVNGKTLPKPYTYSFTTAAAM